MLSYLIKPLKDRLMRAIREKRRDCPFNTMIVIPGLRQRGASRNDEDCTT
jgi:hypothetical protein